MAAVYIGFVLLHFLLNFALSFLCLVLDGNFGRGDGKLADLAMDILCIPTILLGMFISSFWDVMWTSVILYILISAIIGHHMNKNNIKNNITASPVTTTSVKKTA
jgi:hypothetical protein